jgi:hypothetical protein
MASKSQRTTFAKLNRENKVRERRREKQARREARKREAATHGAQAIPVIEDGPAAGAS